MRERIVHFSLNVKKHAFFATKIKRNQITTHMRGTNRSFERLNRATYS